MEEESLFGDLMIFPNPGRDFISIELNSEVGASEVCVYDLKGVLQLRKKLSPVLGQGVLRLNISSLTSGNYILKIQWTQGSYTRQLRVD